MRNKKKVTAATKSNFHTTFTSNTPKTPFPSTSSATPLGKAFNSQNSQNSQNFQNEGETKKPLDTTFLEKPLIAQNKTSTKKAFNEPPNAPSKSFAKNNVNPKAKANFVSTPSPAPTLPKITYALLCGLMLLTSAIWGISFVVVKDSLNKIGATWMIAIRFSIAALFLSLIYIKKLFKTDKKTFLRGVLLGFFLFMAYLLQTIGCKYTTAGKNAFLTTIYVFLVPIMCVPLMHSRLKLRALFFAFLALTGLALLSLGGSADSIGSFNRGDALTILCGIFFALHMACGKSFTQNSDPMILSVWQFITAGVLGFALAPILDGTGEVILSALKNRSIIISLLYLGIFSSMFGFVSQNVGLKYLPSNVASLLLSFESVFGALFGVILLSEPLTPLMGAGCALMTLALILTEVFG